MRKKSLPVRVLFWGTRGSVPAPGPATVKVGGNTSCVEVRYGGDSLILDAGTGIRLLGLGGLHGRNHSGLPCGSQGRKAIPILISHSHMDHIGGLPFFKPALQKGRRLDIYGPPGLGDSLKRLFPFPILPSKRRIREIRPGPFNISAFRITCRWLNHPGKALAYRIVAPSGRVVVYISDHEPVGGFRHNGTSCSDETLIRWIDRPDLLIMDAQYFEREYKRCRGWGHSPLTYAVWLALESRAGRLALFHHDPAHSDARLRQKLLLARRLIGRLGGKMSCSLATEGEGIILP